MHLTFKESVQSQFGKMARFSKYYRRATRDDAQNYTMLESELPLGVFTPIVLVHQDDQNDLRYFDPILVTSHGIRWTTDVETQYLSYEDIKTIDYNTISKLDSKTIPLVKRDGTTVYLPRLYDASVNSLYGFAFFLLKIFDAYGKCRVEKTDT